MAPTLDELINQTRTQAATLEPLGLLASAAQVQQELAELGEQLLDHFVQEARAAGCSWSQIGTALGVSKQAAQQRHSSVRSVLSKVLGSREYRGWRPFARFTAPARQAVVLAQEEAKRLHHTYVGTEHLLLGLLAEGTEGAEGAQQAGGGVAAQALRDAGISLEAARAGLVELIPPGEPAPCGHLPFTPWAKKVLELALREAMHLHHDHIGTEHLLLGLLREGEGLAVQLIVSAGAQPDRLREDVLSRLAGT
jgi:hypothetical protein